MGGGRARCFATRKIDSDIQVDRVGKTNNTKKSRVLTYAGLADALKKKKRDSPLETHVTPWGRVCPQYQSRLMGTVMATPAPPTHPKPPWMPGPPVPRHSPPRPAPSASLAGSYLLPSFVNHFPASATRPRLCPSLV